MFTNKNNVEVVIKMSLKVIQMYRWLLDLYVLDFFVENHWERLPASWQKSFQNMNPKNLGDILAGEGSSHILPLSFLTLRIIIKTLSISRNSCYKILESKPSIIGSHPKLKNLFLKHVKFKKRHEISLMADVVKNSAIQNKCDTVIDFGSGIGHLVRVLSYKHELDSIGLECQLQLTQEARKLDLELEYTAKKHISNLITNLHRPTHLHVHVTSELDLQKLVLPEGVKTYGLVGLHPCGDLGPLLLKHFVDNDQVKFIALVGCCYMKLTCKGDGSGYPLSGYVKASDNMLSYTSREIACHAIEVYSERLRREHYEDLKVHAYRAALERILVEHDPKLKHAAIRSIKHTNTMNFQRYCTLALEHLGELINISQDTWERGESDLNQWRRVVIFYTLRLALAPLVETVILLDRVLYLLEHGLNCEIRAVFDPKISPRNHIIIASR